MSEKLEGYRMTGFNRPITKVMFNIDGDLVFASSLDTPILSWRGKEPLPLGFYKEHDGAISSFDLTDDSKFMVSSSYDYSIIIWDTEKCLPIKQIFVNGVVHYCSLSISEKLVFLIYRINDELYNLNVYSVQGDVSPPIHSFVIAGATPTCGIWTHNDEQIICGMNNGSLCIIDLTTKEQKIHAAHESEITSIEKSRDELNFITSSADSKILLWDIAHLKIVKTFHNDIRINCATLSPYKNYIICGGGVKAEQVTQTRYNNFDASIFSTFTRRKFANVSGHNGPINSICFRPDGTGFVSGAEDSSLNCYNMNELIN